MKWLSGLLVAIAATSASAGPIPTVELLWTGKAHPFYDTTTETTQEKILSMMRQGQMAERMATVAQSFRLRHDVGVGFKSCGEPNAFYSPQNQSVTICTEFVALIIQEMKDDPELLKRIEGVGAGPWIMGVVWGVYFHELAHALIHVNRIPVTGREEDVADQFSFWFAVNYVNLAKQPIVAPVVWFWKALAKRRDLGSMSGDALHAVLSNEHSLDEQRTYNLACWSLGANAVTGQRAADFAGLPNSRAVRCPSEYTGLHNAMRNSFVKYIKAKPLQ